MKHILSILCVAVVSLTVVSPVTAQAPDQPKAIPQLSTSDKIAIQTLEKMKDDARKNFEKT